jgi:hypothetical protein
MTLQSTIIAYHKNLLTRIQDEWQHLQLGGLGYPIESYA